ncbi:four helix bundle protein [Nonlabens ponticola]|uniref:Four helix bundle protein n=1 Tax=Nonlabens ponticola TaxID=2496866 RepID=A0A3S9MV68_9FLAO|nr:four helix bundle protein [Nonlabens ponticola]AZQ43075.1 four helix bundle protein [Nonlabens ponticola]
MSKTNPIVDLSFQFSLEIIEFVQVLKEQKNWELSSQIFRSGTSIGANIHEAQGAESRNDFVHKLKIASKECLETDYWLQLCKTSQHLPTPPELLFEKRTSIAKLLSSIIASTKRNTPIK